MAHRRGRRGPSASNDPRRLASPPLAGVASALVFASLGATACGGVDESVAELDAAPRPSDEVELVVDGLGITHVYARNDGDAFFGAGYAMARDRLFQMELSRRRALGSLAEVFGEASLTDDISARTIGFGRLGEADAARVRAEHPEDAAVLERWVDGVNLRILEVERGEAPRPYGLGPGELDFVPAPWTPGHAYAVGKLLAFGLSNTLDPEILATAIGALAPDVMAHLPLAQPAFDTFILPEAQAMAHASSAAPRASAASQRGAFVGPRARPELPAGWRYRRIERPLASNNWAVAAEHSANGRPFVCGDPHQSLTSPTRLWPVHMSSVAGGGTLDVIGFGFVGTPTVELGHNAHVGWTATTNYADVMDLWDVEVDPSFASLLLGGEAHPIDARDEIIRVRREGAPFGEADEVTHEVLEVPGRGVLLPDELLPLPRSFLAQGRLLFGWTGFAPTPESLAYLEIDRAADLDAFERAVDRLEVGAVNFVAADATGIDYRVHARVPDRGDPASLPEPWKVMPGADPAGVWTGAELGPDRLPSLRDPGRGFVSTANNDPFGFTADGDITNDPFYYGGFYATAFRAYRIDEALTELTAGGAKVSRADMEALQRDVHSPVADSLLPHLADAVAAVGADPALAAYAGRQDLLDLAARLGAWDRRMSREAGEPIAFLALQWFAAKRALREPLSAPLFEAIAEISPPFLIGALHNILEHRFADWSFFVPEGERVLLLAALDDAATWLTARFGSTDPSSFALGDVHAAQFETSFGGELEVAPVVVDGGLDTINVSPAPFFDGSEPRDEFRSTEMSLYRMVVGFGEDGTAEATIDFARGTSEDPASPHFADQEETWAAAGHVPLPFRRADVDASATERIVLGR